MNMYETGGEFALISRVEKILPVASEDVLVGIGDDAAVIRTNKPDEYLLVTMDTLISGQHFQTEWASALQIGIKCAECNVSDIAAMGGKPEFMFVSLALRQETCVEWVEELYRGIATVCERYGISVLGGDTTEAPVEMISITLLGKVDPNHLCLRSHARSGDLLAVTGELGASSAGLHLRKKVLPISRFLEEKHLTPHSRLEISGKIAPYVNAMIDISDGLASEVNHICDQSKTGARIYEEKIPLHAEVIDAAEKLGSNALDFALYGGEDFELLFSVPSENLVRLDEQSIQYYVVGEVTDQKEGRNMVHLNGAKTLLDYSFHHFHE